MRTWQRVFVCQFFHLIQPIIQQLNVLLYNTLNSSLMYYIDIRQAISIGNHTHLSAILAVTSTIIP